MFFSWKHLLVCFLHFLKVFVLFLFLEKTNASSFEYWVFRSQKKSGKLKLKKKKELTKKDKDKQAHPKTQKMNTWKRTLFLSKKNGAKNSCVGVGRLRRCPLAVGHGGCVTSCRISLSSTNWCAPHGQHQIWILAFWRRQTSNRARHNDSHSRANEVSVACLWSPQPQTITPAAFQLRRLERRIFPHDPFSER